MKNGFPGPDDPALAACCGLGSGERSAATTTTRGQRHGNYPNQLAASDKMTIIGEGLKKGFFPPFSLVLWLCFCGLFGAKGRLFLDAGGGSMSGMVLVHGRVVEMLQHSHKRWIVVSSYCAMAAERGMPSISPTMYHQVLARRAEIGLGEGDVAASVS